MLIDSAYDIGDMVYLKTDSFQHERMVTAIKVVHPNVCLYELSLGVNSSVHYDFEFSKEYDLTKKINSNA